MDTVLPLYSTDGVGKTVVIFSHSNSHQSTFEMNAFQTQSPKHRVYPLGSEIIWVATTKRNQLFTLRLRYFNCFIVTISNTFRPSWVIAEPNKKRPVETKVYEFDYVE